MPRRKWILNWGGSPGDLEYRSDRGGVARILDQLGQRNAFRKGGFSAISAEAQEKINALRTNGANWQDEVYQNAINQQYNLSFSGGSEKATYYFSAGYYNEEGTTSGTAFNRYNLTMKTDYNLLKNLKLGTALFVTKK